MPTDSERAAVTSILRWWDDHKYDECGDWENPMNVYGDEPYFVSWARRKEALWKKIKQQRS
jgi:hypothetical protein